MKIVAVSDLHGNLPAVPPCDLLLIGGDVCPVHDHDTDFQGDWLGSTFRDWLGRVPARKVVGVAGNHDFVFETAWHRVPADLPWTYLEDSALEWEGLKIYGSPWQLRFFDWAFNLDEPELAERWALIPGDTDVLVLHGPPLGYGDGVPERGGVRRCGSPSLLARIEAVRPRLVVFGHIHEGRGHWALGPTTLANVSLVDADYRPVHPPWEVELPAG